jgi:hypothetical protein
MMIKDPDYGHMESNPICKTLQEEFMQADNVVVDWNDEDLDKIVRLRLLSDPGYPVWDVSYCWGRLKDGTPVRVELPFDQLSKGRVKAEIIAHAKAEGVYAKGLGLFDPDTISKLV